MDPERFPLAIHRRDPERGGTRILARDTVFGNLTQYGGTSSNTVIEVQQGPDGALYIINCNGWYYTVESPRDVPAASSRYHEN